MFTVTSLFLTDAVFKVLEVIYYKVFKYEFFELLIFEKCRKILFYNTFVENLNYYFFSYLITYNRIS